MKTLNDWTGVIAKVEVVKRGVCGNCHVFLGNNVMSCPHCKASLMW